MVNMAQRTLLLVASMGSFLVGLSAHAVYSGRDDVTHEVSPQVEEVSDEQTLEPEGEVLDSSESLSVRELENLAEQVTVRVDAGDKSGSGILVSREGNTYTIVTNDHVFVSANGSSFPIETFDGQWHSAELIESIAFEGYDLALLKFISEQNYEIASLGDSSKVRVGSPTFAAGFPYEPFEGHPRGFIFNEGEISMISDRSVWGGYQIGYSNHIHKGMSGGPVFNQQGQVIAINGMHAYPLWGNPYVFDDDGSRASPELREQMSHLSWSIPIQRFLDLNEGPTGQNPPPQHSLDRPPKATPGPSPSGQRLW